MAEGDVTEGPLGSAVIGPSTTSWSPSPLHGEEKADGVTADG